MDVGEAVQARRSVRAFLDTPVDREQLRDLAVRAARAATGGNLQPWHIDIVAGDAMIELKAIMRGKLERGEVEAAGYDVYPREMTASHKARRAAVGEAMYGHLGIPRDDKPGRLDWFRRNFQFFGAPAACFCTVDRGVGPPQWADCGMYLQNLMLLATDAGLATCPQECWAMYAGTVERFLGTPPERMLFCAVAIGHEDAGAPVNRLRTDRAPPSEWLTEHGSSAPAA